MAKKTYKVFQADWWPYQIRVVLSDDSVCGTEYIAEILIDIPPPPDHTLAKFNAYPSTIKALKRAEIMCAALNEDK